MKAVRFKDQKISLIDAPIPEVSNSEALIKVMMVGICATDIELFKGYQDFSGIPGHEFVGLVEKAPRAPELVGKRVVAEINVGCGDCLRCRSGDARHCPSRQAIGIHGRDGAFAEYVAVPVDNLIPLPDHLESIDAVFAEPLAAALEVTQQIHVRHNMRIAVLGDGRLGQLCAQALNLYSGHVVMLGRHDEKLAIATGQGIGTENISGMSGQTIAGRWQEDFDMVVEATGNPDAINQALLLVKSEGVVVVKTTSHKSSVVDLAGLVVREITITGSRCGDVGFAVKYLADGRIKPGPLVERVYPFSDFAVALDRAMTRGSLKVLLAFE